MSSPYNLPLAVAICLVLAVSVWSAPSKLNCHDACRSSTDSSRFGCNCTNDNDKHPADLTMSSTKNATTETPTSTTQAPQTTTIDICTALCILQAGGNACDCNNSSLPGKK